MGESPKGLRKGTWTTEEDILLRQCIDKYGEGKWHRVPLRTGICFMLFKVVHENTIYIDWCAYILHDKDKGGTKEI